MRTVYALLLIAAVLPAAQKCHPGPAVVIAPAHPMAAAPIFPIGAQRFQLQVTAAIDPEACPHYNSTKQWLAWRLGHPHAHSRYPGGNKLQTPRALAAEMVVVRVTRSSLSFQQDDEDMEPYMDGEFGNYDASWFGKCGCPLDIALRSCGWIHAMIWH